MIFVAAFPGDLIIKHGLHSYTDKVIEEWITSVKRILTLSFLHNVKKVIIFNDLNEFLEDKIPSDFIVSTPQQFNSVIHSDELTGYQIVFYSDFINYELTRWLEDNEHVKGFRNLDHDIKDQDFQQIVEIDDLPRFYRIVRDTDRLKMLGGYNDLLSGRPIKDETGSVNPFLMKLLRSFFQ